VLTRALGDGRKMIPFDERHDFPNFHAARWHITPTRINHLPHPVRKPSVVRLGRTDALQHSTDDGNVKIPRERIVSRKDLRCDEACHELIVIEDCDGK